jgi:DNA-binding PadR family transcriptional regulator
MSPVFRHGRLRLYLLKLLDESPRHGYEVIRLLQDRFLGVYAPSPGTIYPRLARLEEDGLVTHEEVDGKKVYSITDKGREEIHSRLSDLADLEDELTESLRDVAREISEDVRETVRGIREELTSAFRNQQATRSGDAMRSRPGDWSVAGTPAEDRASAPDGPAAAERAADGEGTSRADGSSATDHTAPPDGKTASQNGPRPDDETARVSDEARRIREEARRTREEMRAKFRARNRGEWASWQERIGRPDLAGWAPWNEWGRDDAAGPGQPRGTTDQRPGRGPSPFTDLERMAIQFANELRTAARQAGNVGERSLSDLRDILTDTLAKVRVEVFTESAGKSESADASDEAQSADAAQPRETGSHGPDAHG